jgi:uncharacterized sulfatase
MVPLREPLTELQDRVINDMYDTEIYYEDRLMRQLYRYLEQPEVRDNTLVIITSDHGEGMNNHDFVGHSLVAYDDLVRVPLIVRYPRNYPAGQRVTTPTSTRRAFHTALEAAGITEVSNGNGNGKIPIDVEGLSLSQALNGHDKEHGIVFTEAYTPNTLLQLMQAQDPEAIDIYRCHQMRRAVYQENHKLITVGDEPDELFDVIRDPGERENLLAQEPQIAQELDELLETFLIGAESRRPGDGGTNQLDLEEDTELAARLRGLGYIE